MTKQEFIQCFIDQYGYLPDEETLQEMFPSSHPRMPAQLSYLDKRRINRPRGEDLLNEIKGIFSDLATYAKSSVHKKPKLTTSSPWMTEFAYMAAVFAGKTFLYFMLQASYKNGFDYSNL